jgi:hypothetical protein
MDEKIAQQMLDELLPSLEALETQSAAVLQFIKDKGLATDEDLAAHFKQAENASSVKWHAMRLRLSHLLAAAAKRHDTAPEKAPTKTSDRDEPSKGKGAEKASPQQEVSVRSDKESDPKKKSADTTSPEHDVAMRSEKEQEEKKKKETGSNQPSGEDAA